MAEKNVAICTSAGTASLSRAQCSGDAKVFVFVCLPIARPTGGGDHGGSNSLCGERVGESLRRLLKQIGRQGNTLELG